VRRRDPFKKLMMFATTIGVSSFIPGIYLAAAI
jgi:hypothetical protein